MARGALRTLPAGTRGVDYSFSRPSPWSIWIAGFRFVCRYLADRSVPSSRGKILTPGERDALADMGLGLMLNWEQSAGDPKRGYLLGLAHGLMARELCNELDVPDFVPIVFSCDVNVGRNDWPALEAYWAGAAESAGRVTPKLIGGYVESDFIDRLVELGYEGPMWWPAASSWSSYQVTPNTDIKQLAGYVLNGTSDANLLLRPTDFWFPNDKPVAFVPEDFPPDVIAPTPVVTSPAVTPNLVGGVGVLTRISVQGAQAVFYGDMDVQGVVHVVRWVGPNMDNRLRGAAVNQLVRSKASMKDFTLVGPIPHGDDLTEWSVGNFYAADSE